MKENHITVSGGTQHPIVPQELAEAYARLYAEVRTAFPKAELSRFFPMQGTRYNEYTQLARLTYKDDEIPTTPEEMESYMEPAVRLMVVGRCVNGWGKLEEATADDFALAAATGITQKGFSWLNDDGSATNTYIRKSDKKECRYSINKSKFWRCTKEVLRVLKPESAVRPRWFEHIVWTNLFPIAPPDGGNATGDLQEVQLAASCELLQQQIALYAPTHLLFITDWDGWFSQFSVLFPKVDRVGNSATDIVVGAGRIGTAKAVVTIRPDRTRPTCPKDQAFAAAVVEAFKKV